MLYFFLTYPQTTLLIKTGEKQAEKDFIGYEFSNRRGHEGIKMHREMGGKLKTRLYDEDDLRSPKKANSYIYNAFLRESNEIDQDLAENLISFNLTELIDFHKVNFEKTISFRSQKKINYVEIWETEEIVTLSSIANIQKGTSITKDKTLPGNIPVVAGGQSFAYFHDKFNRGGNVITVSASGAYSGFINYWSVPIFASDCSTIISIDEDKISTKLIYYFIKSIQSVFYTLQRGQAQPHVYPVDLKNVKIPSLDKNMQELIISKFESIEKTESKYITELEALNEKMENLIREVSSSELTKLKLITTKIGSGATPRGGNASYETSGITFIRSQNVYDYRFVEKGIVYLNVEQAKKLDNVTLEKNDILFNITGASIARCCMVMDNNLPARVNQHVSIIRPNELVLPKYLQLVLVSPVYKNQLLQIGEGSTSRQAITKQQLEDFKIPLPSIDDQQIIVDKAMKLENKIIELNEKITDLFLQKETALRTYLNK